MSPPLSTSPTELLRLYLIDRLGSAVLHDVRNAVQAVLGHTALLHAQISGIAPPADIAHKLQQAAERCGRGTMDLNAVLSLPSQRNNSARLNTLLRDNTGFFRSLLKDRRTLDVQTAAKLDSVRVQQQPTMQLLLLWLIRARELPPQEGVFLLQATESSEPGITESGSLGNDTERFVCLHWEDDGPAPSPIAIEQIGAPAALPPSDPDSYWFWLLGSLLRQHGATLAVQDLKIGIRFSVLWPRSSSVNAYAPPRRQIVS